MKLLTDILTTIASTDDHKQIVMTTIKFFISFLLSNNESILHWNSNGLSKRINDLHAFPQKYKIDVIILTNETRFKRILTKSNNRNLQLYRYIVHRNDLPTTNQRLTGPSNLKNSRLFINHIHQDKIQQYPHFNLSSL